MLKYNSYAVTFSEYPDEISLYITLTGCTIRCPLCNSRHLWEDVGTPLDWDELHKIIKANSGITAVVFGGGNTEEVSKLAHQIKLSIPNLKTCWYTGLNEIPKELDLSDWNAVKIGSFIGYPLNDRKTNQIFYEIQDGELVNKTYKFWRTNEIKD